MAGGPVWLDIARRYLGTREIVGKKHNAVILRMWERLKIAVRDDETPWCGAFVGSVLAEAGMRDKIVKTPEGARNWLSCGVPLDRPAVGAIVVFWRGSLRGWSGHVGFVVGVDRNGNLMVLGGNQGNAVSIAAFDRARVLGYRWPSKWPLPERLSLPVLTSNGKLSTNEA